MLLLSTAKSRRAATATDLVLCELRRADGQIVLSRLPAASPRGPSDFTRSCSAPLPAAEVLDLQVLHDRCSLELLIDRGRVALTASYFPGDEPNVWRALSLGEVRARLLACAVRALH